MSDMGDLQRTFQTAILASDGASALPLINGSIRETAGTLFGVYRHAYTARLVEVLQANFETTWALLGDDGFADAAQAYIAAAPSRHRNARWYGDSFAAFLQRRHPDDPIVGDVAALDWSIAAAFDAADSPCVAVDAMAAIHPQQWPGLTFELHGSVRLVPVTTRAAEAFEALSGGGPPGDLAPVPGHSVLVWREGATVRYRALAADEAAGLAALAAEQSFAEICNAVAVVTGPEIAAARSAEMLRTWLECDMITTLGVDG